MYSYGRIESPDPRDGNYNVEDVIPDMPMPIRKFWWDNAWWGDQRRTSHCVAYSWMHWVEDGPVIQDRIPSREKPILPPKEFYNACQKIDKWPGEEPVYKGTSVRAGAKILKSVGIINEYRWAFTVRSMVRTLLTLGPMVVGTKWYAGMDKPNYKGAMTIKGRKLGGHAYVINGVDTEHKFFRIKNSWGRRWGDGGYGYLRFSDMQKLLSEGGDACIASEIKISKSVSIRDIDKAVKRISRAS
jgi:hypothetical protein